MLSNRRAQLGDMIAHRGRPGWRARRPWERIRLPIVLCLAHLALVPSAAEAWGKKAHRIVAAVAESLLDDRTRQAVHELVGPRGLVPVAHWADEIRDARPETAPWHYVNISRGDAAYDPQRHCSSPAAGACVVAAIERFTRQLADPTGSRAARAEALKFVTHFVADIHQPLHCIGEARGGNDIPVEFLGQRDHPVSGELWNLHAVWDGGLIHQSGRTERAYRARLLARLRSAPPDTGQAGSPADWAIESHHLAVDVALELPASGRIGPRYARIARSVIDRQLARAGFRLAEVLRTAFNSHGR